MEQEDQKQDSLLSLSPQILKGDEKKSIQPYLDLLSKALKAEDLTNIAITGNYGSGKSTVIKTFFAEPQENHKPLYISLASFSENRVEDVPLVGDDTGGSNGDQIKVVDIKPSGSKLERKLEISILQQMFYQVKSSKLPDSRFKRINNLTIGKLICASLGAVIWIISVIVLFKFNYIDKLNPNSWSLNLDLDWITLFTSVAFFAGIGYISWNLTRFVCNSKINKLNIKGELELGSQIEQSIFNQHLEEIIYFFERTQFDVVVIEDLDRFESTDIFVKLRELNSLLNSSGHIKRKIVFLYAIKDELFIA